MNHLSNNHDLSLSDWGPYTKKYMGISHVADSDNGIRFDLSVYASLYRRKTEIPNVMWESYYHPWEAAADLSYYSYRQELEWKDKLYTDISFAKIEDDTYLICCDCVNNIDVSQNIVLNYMAYIAYPSKAWDTFNELELWDVLLPEGGVWIDAVDYKTLTYAVSRPTDSLVGDGYLRGEAVGNGFTGKSGIGCGFGSDEGDSVSYNIDINKPINDAKLVIRYKVADNEHASFNVSGIYVGKIELVGNGEFNITSIGIGDVATGDSSLIFVSNGIASIELDGFAIVENSKDVEFVPIPNDHEPMFCDTPVDNSFILKYSRTDKHYGVMWQYPDYEVREILSSELDSYMRYKTHEHVASVLVGDEAGHFSNAFMRPITLKSGESKKVFGIVTCGQLDDVRATLQKYNYIDSYDEMLSKGKKRTNEICTTDEGRKYEFSQQRMAATLLTNVVYPIYTKRSFIKHNTPGRWWDCLYTWDSGFCGIGLCELDISRAVECLNTYLTEAGDDQAAFIHHGSMVPVQFYLCLEIMNKTQDKEVLSFFYPKLKQYYKFYSGALGSSTTRSMKSNILKTWDYFYNSGGWDDYPPQKHISNNNELSDTIAPVISTAQCIRIAKIMSMAAVALGQKEDVKYYKDDIDMFSKALYDHSWDSESGYFSYVCHNDDGNPTGIMRAEDGSNFNMGLDGMYPLVSGICDEATVEILLDRLFDTSRFFTPIGITTVDMQASYYRKDGYWNGAVWMPHQWFFWKTMLDLGRHDLAYKIADCALNLWEREVRESYNCYEHFVVESGRGAGWHHFGGLSSPVVSWHRAYYGVGTLTVGFDTWVKSKEFTEDKTHLEAELVINKDSGKTAIIACMNPDYSYRANYNGKEVAVYERHKGTIEIVIKKMGTGVLIIKNI